MNIAVFGAQGVYGTKLIKRISTLIDNSDVVRGTIDKERNPELAKWADIIVLCVRKEQTKELLKEISPLLKKPVQIYSFVALFPVKEIKRLSNREVVSILSDIDWNIAYILTAEKKHKLIDCMERIANNVVRVKTQEEFNEFTLLIAYLFVLIAFSSELSESNHQMHIAFLKRKMRITDIQNEDIAITHPEEMKTKGGITEYIYTALQENSDTEVTSMLQKLQQKFL